MNWFTEDRHLEWVIMGKKEVIQIKHYDAYYRKNNNDKNDHVNSSELPYIEGMVSTLTLTDLKILELGCGDGYLTGLLLDKSQNCSIDALDISPVAIKKITNKFKDAVTQKRLQPICSDVIFFLEKSDFKYNLVIGSGILHHIDREKWLNLFRCLHKSLKERGVVVFSPEPNVNGYLYFFWRFAHFFYNNIYHIEYDRNAEIGTFDMKPDEIIKLAKSAGFSEVVIKPYKYIPQFGFHAISLINQFLTKNATYKFATYITIKLFR